MRTSIGCVRNPFLAENFVLTNDKLQVPHIHQEQEVMIMRINQTLKSAFITKNAIGFVVRTWSFV